MSKTHLTEQKFSDFALHPQVVEALEKKGFYNCTPIQALALPLTLAGRDVAGQAQTGTGKTMAFLTSTFHYLLSHPAIDDRKVNQPRALIMAPTRELAVQIHADAEPLAQATGLKLGLAYGGDGYDKQLKVLESGVDILIGTTGRLIDYAKQNHINLGAIQVVVLDEADRMYDLGFIKDIRWLFRRMPPAAQRLNMLFSATLSYRVRELAFEQMNNAEYVEVEPEQKTGHRIKEELFYPSNEEKMRLLQTLIEEEWPDRAIIFANTKHRCEDIWGHLAADGHRVGLLTGDVAQKKRLRILDEFTRGDLEELEIEGLTLERALVFPSGLAILIAIFTELNIQSMTLAGGALREGLVYGMLHLAVDQDIRSRTLRNIQRRFIVDTDQANRVAKLADNFLKQVENAWHIEPISRELLLSACQLHEIGLSVDFKQAPYHAAYLVRHLDLPGYTPAQKKLLATLLLNQTNPVDLSSLHQQNAVPPRVAEQLCRLLRLAILFAGRRRDDLVPEITLQALNENLTLTLPGDWLAHHPLGKELIDQESQWQSYVHWPLDVR